MYETFVAVDDGQILGPAISNTTTATIAQVAQRGMFGLLVSLLALVEFLPFCGNFLLRNFVDFLPALGLRFEDEGFAGGGGGGSLVTWLMLRPDFQTMQNREPCNCLV